MSFEEADILEEAGDTDSNVYAAPFKEVNN